MKRPIFSALNAATVNAANRYYGFEAGNSGSGGGTSNNRRTPVGAAGVVSDAYISLSAAPGAGTSYTWTLYKNNIATSLSVTISDTDLTGSDIDAGHAVTVAAGDDLAWLQAPTNTPTNGLLSNISVLFTGTNNGETTISGCASSTFNGTVASYWGPNGGTTNATASVVRAICPTSFTLDQLYYRLDQGAGAGDTFTITVYKNGSATALTTGVSGAAQVDNSDLVNSVSFAAEDYLAIEIIGTGTPSGARHAWGMRLTPGTDGESPVFSYGAAVLSLVTRFPQVSGSMNNIQTELNGGGVAPIAFDLKKLYCEIEPAQAATKDWRFNSRISGVDGTLSATILATTTSANDITHTDSYAVGQRVNWESNPTSGGTNTTQAAVSAVTFIDPGPPAGDMWFMTFV